MAANPKQKACHDFVTASDEKGGAVCQDYRITVFKAGKATTSSACVQVDLLPTEEAVIYHGTGSYNTQTDRPVRFIGI